MSRQSPPLLGVVVCMEGDLGLRGDILKRYETQPGPHSIFPFGKVSKYETKDARGTLKGKAKEENRWMCGEQLCKAATEVPEQVRFDWTEQQPGTHSVLWGFLPVFSKVPSTPITPTPSRVQGECVGW